MLALSRRSRRGPPAALAPTFFGGGPAGAPASVYGQAPLRSARSFAIRCSAMRRLSSKVLPITRYLPLTTSIGVESTPLAIRNCCARLSLALIAKLFIVLWHFFGSAQNL